MADCRLSASPWPPTPGCVGTLGDTEVSEALKPGSWIHVLPGHGMQVVAGRWDAPIEADHSPPPPAADLTAIANAPGEVTLAWTPAIGPGLPAVAYKVLRDGRPVGTSIDGRFVDTGLAEETEYAYSVRAVRRLCD